MGHLAVSLTACAHDYCAEMITPHTERQERGYVVLEVEDPHRVLFLYTCIKCGHAYTGPLKEKTA